MQDGASIEVDIGACVIWTGYCNAARGGYGITGRRKRAHRVAWEKAFGEIPDGLHVLHRCDNPPCVNPEHLFLGTHADNMRDMCDKGRRKGGAPTGEKNQLSKLRAADVIEMRNLSARGVRDATLARLYGVVQSTVYSILTNRTWRHV